MTPLKVSTCSGNSNCKTSLAIPLYGLAHTQLPHLCCMCSNNNIGSFRPRVLPGSWQYTRPKGAKTVYKAVYKAVYIM